MADSAGSKLNYDRVISLAACVLVNGIAFGEPFQTSLKGNDASKFPTVRFLPSYSEPGLRSNIGISFTASRHHDSADTAVADKTNPLGHAHHAIFVDCHGRTIRDVTITKASVEGLPAAFNCTDFDPVGKAFLTFKSDAPLTKGLAVPQLHTDALTSTMRAIATEIDSTITAKAPLAFFCIISPHRYGSRFISSLTTKIAADIDEDPLYPWSKNSPAHHQLELNNIHPVHDRPPFSMENFIVAPRSQYADRLDMQVPIVYGEVGEHEYEMGIREEWTEALFATVFAPIPGSAFAANANDNALPKLILAYISLLGKDIPKPQPGDRFSVYMPFPIPDCPEYDGPDRKKSRSIDDNDYDYADFDPEDMDTAAGDGEEIIAPDAAAGTAIKLLHAQDADLLREDRLLHTWVGTVVQVMPDTPAGVLILICERPTDVRWMGKKDPPRVATIIPFMPHKFRNAERLGLEIQQQLDTHPHELKIAPLFSDKTFKDIIRTTSIFFKLMDRPSNSTQINVHLAHYLLSFNKNLAYPVLDFFHPDIAGNNWARYTDDLSPYQKEVFDEALQRIEHGMLFIEGCVGSSKSTLAAILSTILVASGRHSAPILMVQETNVGVDHQALQLAARFNRYGLGKKLIIRVGSLPEETQRFISRVHPTEFKERFRSDTNDVDLAEFAALGLLNDYGQAYSDDRQQGDKRFKEECANLTLHEAMWKRLHEYMDCNKNYFSLLAALNTQADSPDDVQFSPAEVTALLTSLRRDTLAAADVVLCTTSIALRPAIADAIARPTALFQDEACKAKPSSTYGLIGLYRPQTFYALIGDSRQLGPYFITADNPEFPNPFYRAATLSVLARARDHRLPILTFYEQHRMWTPYLTSWLSHRAYHGMMRDGNRDRAPIAQVQFVYDFLVTRFGIKKRENFVVIETNGSRSFKEEGSTSLQNLHHVALVVQIMRDFKSYIDDADTSFNRSDFSVVHLTPYKKQQTLVEEAIRFLHDSRFRSLTVVGAQGITAGLVIFEIPNERLSAFVNEYKAFLVAMTRHSAGVIVIVTESAIDPSTYSMTADRMYRNPRVNNIYALYGVGLDLGNVFYTDVPDISKCNKCGAIGHQRADCSTNAKCYNCLELGHGYRDCPDEKLRDPPKMDPTRLASIICHNCSQMGHMKPDCPGCKVCKTAEHAYADCPQKFCKTCQTSSHWTIGCPKINICSRCGTAGHQRKACTETLTRSRRAAYKVIQHNNTTWNDENPQFQRDLQATMHLSITFISPNSLQHGAATSDEQERIQLAYAIAESKITANHKRRFSDSRILKPDPLTLQAANTITSSSTFLQEAAIDDEQERIQVFAAIELSKQSRQQHSFTTTDGLDSLHGSSFTVEDARRIINEYGKPQDATSPNPVYIKWMCALAASWHQELLQNATDDTKIDIWYTLPTYSPFRSMPPLHILRAGSKFIVQGNRRDGSVCYLLAYEWQDGSTHHLSWLDKAQPATLLHPEHSDGFTTLPNFITDVTALGDWREGWYSDIAQANMDVGIDEEDSVPEFEITVKDVEDTDVGSNTAGEPEQQEVQEEVQRADEGDSWTDTGDMGNGWTDAEHTDNGWESTGDQGGCGW
ncbi:uncharacterized protein BP5553_09338 [Venustampulla echinocandica]|uniref:CCHC-type domain-containing protein n=1 Tax=Venustampulla echinocandica TaxID=2656787 RepID=A0A370TCI2_9HELO|nr:uncharacterized protein BP5553_09338 [Venustampulla echinocandica]RDL31936.1 hypothetical protein BP5553_09338 [Venustampulla echinocandica]